MPKKDTRSIRNHHIAFGIASALLVASTLWAFYNDQFEREYPKHQEKYLELEQARIGAQLQEIEAELLSMDDGKVTKLWQAKDDAQKALEETRKEAKAEFNKARLSSTWSELVQAMELEESMPIAEAQERLKRQGELEKEMDVAGNIVYAEWKLKELAAKIELATRIKNFANADLGVASWGVEDAKQKGEGESPELQRALERHAKQKLNLADAVEYLAALNRDLDGMKKVVAATEEPYNEAKRAYEGFITRRADLKRSLTKLKGIPAINIIRDAPGIDIPDPRYNMADQVVMKNLPVDYKFALSQRVDRCVVCHKAIDNTDPMYSRAGREKLKAEIAELVNSGDPEQAARAQALQEKVVPNVLLSHPRLDLFVSASSKHPFRDGKKFGCTICHSGRPMGASFLRAAHTPQNDQQAAKWRKEHGWNTLDQHVPGQPLWDAPMLPLQYIEASCAKCHKGVDNVPEAPRLNLGRELYRSKGCANCHTGDTDADMAWVGRIGPDLRRIGEKTTAQWTHDWVANPWHFRPSTKMPRLFGLENRANDELAPPEGSAGAHALPRDPVEIESIVTYLYATSKLREKTFDATVPEGDAAKGKELFQSVGCLGCHSTAEAPEGQKFSMNTHGPDLSRIGEKVNTAWLYRWLKDPHAYWPESKMPSLRLSDQEAADLTAYLKKDMHAERKDPAIEAKPAPAWAFDQLVHDILSSKESSFSIRKKLEDPEALVRNKLRAKAKYANGKDTGTGEWTDVQIDAVVEALKELAKDKGKEEEARLAKAFFVGENMIQHYGCFACHNVQGWTYAPLNCVNLAGEADKDIGKFDFGKTPISQNHWEFFYNKIARPRVFDRRKNYSEEQVKEPLFRLKMPWFGFKADTFPEDKKHHGAHGGGEAEGGKPHAANGVQARAAGGGAHDTIGSLTAYENPDLTGQSDPHGLTHDDVEALVTHLLSTTRETVPLDMRYTPKPKDVAVDRGERVIRELNCAGCHSIGIEQRMALPGVPVRPKQLVLAALLTKEVQEAAEKLGVYCDEDLVSVDYDSGDAATSAASFLNFGRGTYVTKNTIPILAAEKEVRRNALAPWEKIGFTFLSKNQTRGKKGEWVAYGDLITEAHFVELVKHFLPAEEAAQAYAKYAGKFVEKGAYERLAGTAALAHAPEGTTHYVSPLKAEMMKAAGEAYEPVSFKVRWTDHEGHIIAHQVSLHGAEGTKQFAPPSLAYEGGKVQPDWLYAFLHDVHTLRPGMKIRMPSFWSNDPNAAKNVYPAGHLSALKVRKRGTGPGAEPMPPAGSSEKVADAAAELVEFFQTIGEEAPLGYLNVPSFSGANRARQEEASKLIYPATPTNPEGLSCTTCHSLGAYLLPKEVGPNLQVVKQRFKPLWLRRFLSYPQAYYPWANMPSNFFQADQYVADLEDPTRGLTQGDVEKFKKIAHKLNEVHRFLRNTGELNLGVTVPVSDAPPSAPEPKQP